MTVSGADRSAASGPRSTWLVAAAVAMWGSIGTYLAVWGTTWALDLRVYRAAGRSLYHHGAPYLSLFTANRLPFTYPPFALLVLSPLSFGPLGVVKALWWSLNQLALIAILYLVIVTALGIPRRRAGLLAAAGGALATLALEPLRSNLDYAQINLLLMLLVVFDVTRVKAPRRGLLTGLAAAIKLTPLVYLAYFVVDRDRRSAYRGLASFAGATALSWAILPSESARYWFHEAFSPGRTGPVGIVSNQSWNGLVHRVPVHAGTLGVVLWAGASVVTLVVGLCAAKWLIELGRTIDALLALALTELLVSPVSWSHHWSWLVLVPIVLIARRAQDRVVGVALTTVLVIAVVEPYWWPLGGWLGGLLGDSLTLAGAALLGVLAIRARRDLASSADRTELPSRR